MYILYNVLLQYVTFSILKLEKNAKIPHRFGSISNKFHVLSILLNTKILK